MRNYKRRSNRNTWTEESMRRAITAVNEGIRLFKAAVQFGVPRSTLRRRVNDTNQNAKGTSKVNYGLLITYFHAM